MTEDKSTPDDFINEFVPVFMLIGMSEYEARKLVIESMIEAYND